MPEACEHYLDFVNTYVYYAWRTRQIYQVLPYSVDFKAPEGALKSTEQAILSKYNLFGIKDM